MAKTKLFYVCNQCGYKTPKWIGKCPQCGEWGSFDEEVELSVPKSGVNINKAINSITALIIKLSTKPIEKEYFKISSFPFSLITVYLKVPLALPKPTKGTKKLR